MHEKARSEMRIAVLCGGRSSEREVSLMSGENAAAALREAGFGTVDLLDPADGEFAPALADGRYDAAFLALHGAGGEDGTIQGLLETFGIPYTGSGVAASAVAADKELSKLCYRRDGIPTPPSVTLHAGESHDLEAIAGQVGPRCFVKPAVNGSSYGISFVKEPSELAAAIELAFTFDDKVLVERRVEGTEITVGVFGRDGDLRALPIVEVCAQNEGAEFYDLSVKYVDPAKVHRIPARLSPADRARAEELAVAAHRSLGCLGISRSDFIVDDVEGPIILETNTLPGMTSASLYPDEIRHTDDLTFPEVCAALIEMGIERARAR